MEFGTILRYSDLFGKKPSLQGLKKLIRQFKRTNLLAQLSSINAFLSINQLLGNDDEKWLYLQQRLVANFISDNILDEKINPLLQGVSPAEVSPFSRLTTIYLARLCILYSSESAELIPDGKHQGGYQLGLGYLKANDYLLTQKEEKKFDSLTDRTIKRHLALQFAPLLEFYNPIRLRNGVYRFQKLLIETKESTEFKEIIRRKPKKNFDLDREFLNATGLTLENYRDFTIGMMSYLTPPELEETQNFLPTFNRKKFISKSTIEQERFDSYLSLEGIGIEDLKKNLQASANALKAFRFQEFRIKPLIEIEPSLYTAIDPSFVADKLGLAGFWKIHDVLPTSLQEKFRDYFALLFEVYTNNTLKESVDGDPLRRGIFISNPDYKGGGEPFDAMVYFPGSKHLIVFEHKASLLKDGAKYSGSIRKLESELKKKFLIDDKSKPRGVGQLVKHIENLFHSNPAIRRKLTNKFFQEILPHVEKISPVIIGLDPFLRVHMMEGLFLGEYFKKEMKVRQKKKTITNRVKINPLTVIHIEVLETLAPYLKAGDASFEQLLNLRFARDPEYKRFFAASTFFQPEFGLLSVTRKNQEVSDYFDRIWEEAAQSWFGKDYKLPQFEEK